MGEYSLPGNPPVTINLRKSGRARRISLRVSRLDGRVTLTQPIGVSEKIARDFADEKADWIRAQLQEQPTSQTVTWGTIIPVAGEELQIAPAANRSVTIEGKKLLVPGPQERVPARLVGFLKHLARDRLAAASDHHAHRLGVTYQRISLRDTRSRWGSCSSAGGLMYSWRLIMAPPAVLDYVAAHEVAHLREMNHSAAFWELVAQTYGDYAAPRRWLREQGTALHRYRFGD